MADVTCKTTASALARSIEYTAIDCAGYVQTIGGSQLVGAVGRCTWITLVDSGEGKFTAKATSTPWGNSDGPTCFSRSSNLLDIGNGASINLSTRAFKIRGGFTSTNHYMRAESGGVYKNGNTQYDTDFFAAKAVFEKTVSATTGVANYVSVTPACGFFSSFPAQTYYTPEVPTNVITAQPCSGLNVWCSNSSKITSCTGWTIVTKPRETASGTGSCQAVSQLCSADISCSARNWLVTSMGRNC